VEGHTDNKTGKEAYKLTYRRQRAAISKKTFPNTFESGTKDFPRSICGEENHCQAMITEAGRQQNRRVEVAI